MKIPKPGPELKSYHDGANEERSCVLAKVRRMRKGIGVNNPLEVLEKFLIDRDKRYKKRAGGL